MKTKRANNAISEIIGTMLMLGISVSLFSVVYISVLTVPYSPPTPSANIIYQIDDGNIVLSHYGGKALNLDTKIVMRVDGQPVDSIPAGDYLCNDFNGDGLWSVGEKVVFSYESLVSGGEQIEVNILDIGSNSLVMTGEIQVGIETILVISTSVDAIIPYESSSSPISLTATGPLNLDNVTLYYRWSDDNSTWDGSYIDDENNNTVDSNSCEEDASPDKGIETNFSNAQDVIPDSDVMNIQEENNGGGSSSEWLNCNAFDSTNTDWTEVGSSPYLDAQDQSTNLITCTSSWSDEEGWFDFPDTSLTGALNVNISIYCNNDDGAGDDYADVIVDYTGSGSGSSVGSIGQHTSWSYDTIDLGSHTVSEVNNLRVFFKYEDVSWDDDVRIDHVRLGVSSLGGDNYETDFEYQWTTADYDKENKEVCIYVDSHTGSENLNINYYNGGSWTNLGTITSTGWNNFSAAGLISSTYTIQLIGATESSDSNQDNWDIDCMYLHTWNSTGGPYGWKKFGTDTSHPWIWSFDYPIGIGYYQFYSIGQKLGLSKEIAPAFPDAICRRI